MLNFLDYFSILTVIFIVLIVGHYFYSKIFYNDDSQGKIKRHRGSQVIMGGYLVLLVLFAGISFLNVQQKGSAPVDMRENAPTYQPNQERLNREDRAIDKENPEKAQLRIACERDRANLVNYENNYCEQYEEMLEAEKTSN